MHYSFVEVIRTQAGWRRAKAEEYPDDDRNLRSAEALEKLAAGFDIVAAVYPYPGDYPQETGLPRDVYELQMRCTFPARDGVPQVAFAGDRVKAELARFGFDSDPIGGEQIAAFVRRLAALSAQDAYESLRTWGDYEGPYGLGDDFYEEIAADVIARHRDAYAGASEGEPEAVQSAAEDFGLAFYEVVAAAQGISPSEDYFLQRREMRDEQRVKWLEDAGASLDGVIDLRWVAEALYFELGQSLIPDEAEE